MPDPQTYVYHDHPEAVTATKPPLGRQGFFVYRCKDAAARIVYVGHTTWHPVARLAGHRAEHKHRMAGRVTGEPWYHLMASMDWAEVPTLGEAKAEERRQMFRHDPIGNVSW
jgi:hypothetical protein